MGKRARPLPSRDQIDRATPLRLDIAAELAFPDGSMGASGLRREAARGRLAIERIAGKDYTTLQAIEDMRERCRVEPKATACGSIPRGATRTNGSWAARLTSGPVDDSVSLASALMLAKKLSAPPPKKTK